MTVLVADDDDVLRRLVLRILEAMAYGVREASDGAAALEVLLGEDPPSLAVINWMMPGMNGVEICRRVRGSPVAPPVYIIMLTARGETADIVEGLSAGADDYITKPFDAEELRARVRVGERVVRLQAELGRRVGELEEALAQVRRIQGLLPICSYCKKIRDDDNYWQAVEHYIASRSEARFSHGICPECHARYVEPLISSLEGGGEAAPGPPTGRDTGTD